MCLIEVIWVSQTFDYWCDLVGVCDTLVFTDLIGENILFLHMIRLPVFTFSRTPL